MIIMYSTRIETRLAGYAFLAANRYINHISESRLPKINSNVNLSMNTSIHVYTFILNSGIALALNLIFILFYLPQFNAWGYQLNINKMYEEIKLWMKPCRRKYWLKYFQYLDNIMQFKFIPLNINAILRFESIMATFPYTKC